MFAGIKAALYPLFDAKAALYPSFDAKAAVGDNL